jgi:tape measure domain-containing protein
MANKIVETIYRVKDEVTAGLARISAAWRGAAQDAEATGNAVSATTGGLARGFTAATIAIKRYGAAIAAVGVALLAREAVQASVEIVKTGERMEDLTKKLATAFGSVSKGEAAFERLQGIAARTPFAFEEVAAAAVEMRKRGLDPLDGSLQALLDNAAANDQSMSDLAGTIEALGKASLRGEVGTRALISLTERGIPVFDLLGKALGKSEEEIRRMASAGELGAEQIKLLVQELGKLRTGAAAAEAGDLDAQLQKLKDTFADVQNSIAKDGSLEAVRGAFQRVNTALSALAASPEFQRLEESISGVIEGGAQAFENFFENVDLKRLASEFQIITEAIRVMVNALAAADVALEPLFKIIDKITFLNRQLQFMVKAGLIELGDGLEWVAQQADDATVALEGPITPLTAMRAEIEAGRAALQGFGQAFETVQAAEKGLTVAAAKIVEQLGSLSGSATEARGKVAELFEGLSEAPNSRLGDVALALGAVGRESQSAAQNVRDGLRVELAKLSGEDLLRFQQSAQAAFAAFKTASGEAAGILDQTLFVALEKLGVQGDTLGERFSASGKEIIATFQTVVESARSTSDQIEAAFAGALAGATTTAEAEALGVALEQAGKRGQLGLDAMARSAVDLKNRLLELANAADPLADSFARLGIQSQRELDRIAEVARGDFESIRHSAQTGGAAIDDVARAFESMARAQLAAVANAPKFEQQQVQAALRAQGAALGLTETLEELGLVGREAGEQVAAGADIATDALRDTESAASGAAAAAGDLAGANDRTTTTFVNVAGAASDAAFELQGVSDAFRAAMAAQAGLTSAVGSRAESTVMRDLAEQNRLLDEEIRRAQELNAQFDETEQRVAQLRGRFQYLSDDRIRHLAQEQRQFEENQRRRDEEEERRRREARERSGRDAEARPTQRRAEAQPGAGGAAGGITVNVAGTAYGSEIPPNVIDGWSRQIDRQLRQMQGRRG